MSAGVRIRKERLAGEEIKIKLRDIEHPDYKKQVEFIDESGELDEEWVYGITGELTAELMRSTEVDDLLADHEPPEWVQEGLVMWDLRTER
jgi:uncharacterized protein YcsI (UPF0317 family)